MTVIGPSLLIDRCHLSGVSTIHEVTLYIGHNDRDNVAHQTYFLSAADLKYIDIEPNHTFLSKMLPFATANKV